MSTFVKVPTESEVKFYVNRLKEIAISGNFNINSHEVQALIALIATFDRHNQKNYLDLLEINDFDITNKVEQIRNFSVKTCMDKLRRKLVSSPGNNHILLKSLSGVNSNSANNVSSLQYMVSRNGNYFDKSNGNGYNEDNQVYLDVFAQTFFESNGKNFGFYQKRKDFSSYMLDPVTASCPGLDFSRLVKPDIYRYSPQHIGFDVVYPTSLSEKKRKKTKIDLIMQQFNVFKHMIKEKSELVKKLSNSFSDSIKSKDKSKSKKEEYLKLQQMKKTDPEQYKKYLKNMKNDALKELIDKTDHYIKELKERVRSQNSEGIDENEDPADKFDIPLRRPENIKQPSLMKGGQLKEYQIRGLQFLISLYLSNLNGILADEMGLGKTIQSISMIAWLYETKGDHGPHLICAPLSTLANWAKEFRHWLPILNVVQYNGSPQERKEKEATILSSIPPVNVIITTPEFVTKEKRILSKIHYSYLIIDEAHKLKNEKSKLFTVLSKEYKSRNRLLLTGTPLQNNQHELFSLLNFILPNIFDDSSKFEEWFSSIEKNDDTKLTEDDLFIIVNQLHNVLRPFIFRRTTAEVSDELPKMIEKKINVEMSAWQKQMYNALKNDSVIVCPNLSVKRLDNTTMQLRKVCNHPFLFLDSYYTDHNFIRASGKFEILYSILPKLKRFGHRVLIFTQMTEVLNLLEELLNMMELSHFRLDGTTKQNLRQQRIDEFNNPNSDVFAFLLSTRAGGLGLNLQSADTVIIYDNDWNPTADQQARSRVYRIGQKNDVLMIDLVTINSVEERVLNCAEDKKYREAMIIEVGRFDDSTNYDERKNLYKKVVDQGNTDHLASVHSDTEINRIIARNETEFEEFQKMDEERNARSQKNWERSGKTGQYSRLIQYDELPDYLKVNPSDLYKEEEVPLVRKSRSTSSLYNKLENLSMREYSRLDSGEITAEKLIEMREKMETLFSKVSGLCKGLFDVLPTEEEDPEYHKMISSPITLLQIKNRIDEGEYESFDDFISDVTLMANNAQRYNVTTSEYYKIADGILEVCASDMDKPKSVPHADSNDF